MERGEGGVELGEALAGLFEGFEVVFRKGGSAHGCHIYRVRDYLCEVLGFEKSFCGEINNQPPGGA